MKQSPQELIGFLACYPDDVRDLVLSGRELLLERYSPVKEMHFDATTAVCAGISYIPKQSGVFVNFAAYPKHVALVFLNGASLVDPEARLKGEGRQVRHLRLESLEMLRDPYVLELIDQASANAIRTVDAVEHEIIVKVYAGPKRRP